MTQTHVLSVTSIAALLLGLTQANATSILAQQAGSQRLTHQPEQVDHTIELAQSNPEPSKRAKRKPRTRSAKRTNRVQRALKRKPDSESRFDPFGFKYGSTPDNDGGGGDGGGGGGGGGGGM